MRRTLARLLRGWADWLWLEAPTFVNWPPGTPVSFVVAPGESQQAAITDLVLEPPALLPAMFVPPSDPFELTPEEGPPLPQSARNDSVIAAKGEDGLYAYDEELGHYVRYPEGPG